MADEDTMKVTADRSDDADAAPDPHMAGGPAITMAQQQEQLRDGKIVGFTCKQCNHDRFSPMSRCPKCGSSDIGTREFSTTGKVVSYTIQSVAAEQFMNEVPFAFVIVDLDDGPQVSGWVPYISKQEELPLGSAVEYQSSYKPGMQFEKK